MIVDKGAAREKKRKENLIEIRRTRFVFLLENISWIIIRHFFVMIEICSVAPQSRQNCGWGGITPQECEDRGCCFDSSIHGVIWCFYGNS